MEEQRNLQIKLRTSSSKKQNYKAKLPAIQTCSAKVKALIGKDCNTGT
jgi:hypothetical protein